MQDGPDGASNLGSQVLTVVDDEQHLFGPEVQDQTLDRSRVGVWLDTCT